MLLRRLLVPAAALSLSACGSRLFHIPGPTQYERMSMIDCAADVASARGFAVRERQLDKGFLVAEGAWTEASHGEVARSDGAEGGDVVPASEPYMDVLTVAVSRESTMDQIAVQSDTFVVRDTAAARPRESRESRLVRGARAVLGWARPSARVVELRSMVLDRCGTLARRR
jgi:hypothetical protein